MKRLVCAYLMVILAALTPARTAFGADHPLRQFVAANASSDRVTSIESRAGRRWGKVLAGAAIGAGVGLIHAQLTGGDAAKEIAVGAVAGAAVGFAITKIQDRRVADRDAVARAVSYDPSQGIACGVKDVSITPERVKAGEKITVTTTYWAVGPQPSGSVELSRFAGISESGDYMKAFTFAPDPFRFDNGGGEYQTTLEITVPPNMTPGTYNVLWLIDGQPGPKDSSRSFVVNG